MKHPMKGQPTLIVEDVADYRAAIGEVVKKGDVVLEVGCHEGVTTRRIAQEVGLEGAVYGIDTSEVCIERAVTAYQSEENLAFSVGDAMDISSLRKLSPRPFDLIFLDISGSRDLETLIPLMESYEFALRPRLIICKSFRLKRLFLNCTLFNYYASPPGEKVDGDIAGTGEWVKPTASETITVRKTAQVKHARGQLPRDAEGQVVSGALPANAKCNPTLQDWGCGKARRKERSHQLRDMKKENPEQRDRDVQVNVLRCGEEKERAAISKEYDAVLLKLCRELRHEVRTVFKATADRCSVVLHWSKPTGHISWTQRVEPGAAPTAQPETSGDKSA
eukprot:TRINITY_DN12847_c0_g1_i1.p1 TRINITY_DN12847_c0_g1~~TRINITY_DN12847_c0_g1_i1.p1  ORF type:complete len:351 (+),score=122.78 TRINITY_DN12847_c0_g1_i1:53-1054(+)